MPKINTTRGTFHYKDYRKASTTPPIILIHGAGGMYMDWSVVMRRGLNAIAIDLSGHGLSSGNGRTSIVDYALDVVSLMDALDIAQAVIIGHSMGGAIAQQITLDYPDKVLKLILIATGAKLKVGDAILQGLDDDLQSTAELIVKLSWTKSIPDEIRQQGVERLLNTPREVIRDDFIACNGFDVRDRLSEIEQPVLVVAGDNDKMTPLAWNQTLADNITHSEIFVIEGQNHMVHVECAEKVTAKIQEWLANN